MTEELISWVAGKFCEFQLDSDKRKEALVELKSAIGALDSNSLQFLATNIDLTPCINLLSDIDNEIIYLSNGVLFSILSQLSIQDLLSRYSGLFDDALKHKSPVVKVSFLRLLHKDVNSQSFLLLNANHSQLLSEIIQCVAFPDRSVAEEAVSFFKKLGKTNDGASIIFSEGCAAILSQIMQEDDISKFRVYEIAVSVATTAPEYLKAAHECGILPSLLSELKSEDTLVQLNALELMTNLTYGSIGLMYLQREGVIQFLIEKIVNTSNDPLTFIRLPGLIEFFGNLYKLQPIVFAQQHPEVLQMLFQNFDSVDPAILGVVISTVGKIGSSDDGRRVLLAEEDKMAPFFRKIAQILPSSNQLGVTSMNTLACLFATNQIDVSERLGIWFAYLGPDIMVTIVSNAKLPFLEVRVAAFELLKSISLHDWGVSAICSHAGLLEFLLDRNIEFDKDCKYIKHSILENVANNAITSSIVNGDTIAKIERFVKEGPFYIEAEPEVTFEGET